MAERTEQPRREFVVPVDPVVEQVLLAAAMVADTVRKALCVRLRPDHFQAKPHQAAWAAILELERQRLGFDFAALHRIAGDTVDAKYLLGLAEARPEAPDNVDWYVEQLLWDRQRATAASGPVNSLLQAMANPREQPERVRAIARQVGKAFDGGGSHLLDGGELVRQVMSELAERAAGRAVYPYGVRGLDFHADGRRRMVPGAAPGQVTVITGVSGSGKSVLAAHLALGLAGFTTSKVVPIDTVRGATTPRKVLYGAWEQQGAPTVELLACISLGWSRAELQAGENMTRERMQVFEQRCDLVTQRIKFMRNPFRRSPGERKASNERNLDVVQGEIAQSGCDVFIADLWKRCIVDASPEAEEEALYRQQAMVEDMHVHAILVQQQRLKDVEHRDDKRPTREGIKGSGAWTEVADTMLGVHRPALWKRQDDVTVEVFVLKQRYGLWPLGIEFGWSGEHGRLDGGRDVPYDPPGTDAQDGFAGDFVAPNLGKKRR